MTTFAATSLPLASRSTRLLGQIIDGMIAGAPFVGAAVMTGLSHGVAGPLMIVAMLWWIFYHLLADGLPGGQSFAKKWLGIQVISERTGAPCSFGQSFVRNLLLAILGPIDWVFIFGERHQRLGDKAAGTIVVAD